VFVLSTCLLQVIVDLKAILHCFPAKVVKLASVTCEGNKIRPFMVTPRVEHKLLSGFRISRAHTSADEFEHESRPMGSRNDEMWKECIKSYIRADGLRLTMSVNIGFFFFLLDRTTVQCGPIPS
jgi:hypothetical protein